MLDPDQLPHFSTLLKFEVYLALLCLIVFWEGVSLFKGLTSSVGTGQSLSLELSRLLLARESEVLADISRPEFKVPSYKFFGGLVQRELSGLKQFGSWDSLRLRRLREALGKDLQCQKRITDSLIQSYFQFLLVDAMAWAFVLMASQMFDLQLSFSLLFWVAGIQLLGPLSFYLFDRFLAQSKLSFYWPFFQRLLQFQIFSQHPIAVDQVIKQIAEVEAPKFTGELQRSLVKNFELAVAAWRTQGADVSSELVMIESETWHQLEEDLQKYFKSLGVARLACLALFCVVPYFFSVMQLFYQML